VPLRDRHFLLAAGERTFRGDHLRLVLEEHLGESVHRLRAYVVALAHPLAGVVALPEMAQRLLIAGLRSVEGDEHNLGVPCLRVKRIPPAG
jgi:hypothetical protein